MVRNRLSLSGSGRREAIFPIRSRTVSKCDPIQEHTTSIPSEFSILVVVCQVSRAAKNCKLVVMHIIPYSDVPHYPRIFHA